MRCDRLSKQVPADCSVVAQFTVVMQAQHLQGRRRKNEIAKGRSSSSPFFPISYSSTYCYIG
jgi:hypothetical protein